MTTVVEFYISKKERDNALKQFFEYFNKSHAKLVEIGCFNFAQDQCKNNQAQLDLSLSIYKDTVKNLLFNLKQSHRTIMEIITKINNGEYNPEQLAFLKPHELDNDEWEKIIRRKNTTEEKLSNRPSIEWKTCVSCKCKDYYYYQLQTRSADEPITTFYICKTCGKTYSVNN